MMDPQLREYILKAHKVSDLLDGLKVDRGLLGQAVDLGMIPKSNLRDGCYYLGICRGAPVARWNAGLEKFQFLKESMKWVKLASPIPHPEDDDGFDFFIPVLCLNYHKTWEKDNA